MRVEAKKTSIRKRENGTEYEARQSPATYRNEYLTKFCGYTKSKRKAANREKRDAEIDAMIDAAKAAIERR